jgi:large subunit ribosomal protein L22
VDGQELVATARLRYLGTSAQKARLVVDLIRGQDVGRALATLRHTRKAVASEIERLLDSAVANAHQKRQDLDVDRLYVRVAAVDGGPSLKRIRPAPMGRAFRVLKRMCHVTVGLAERRQETRPAPAAPPAAGGRESAPAARPRRPPARRTAAEGARRLTGRAAARRTGAGKKTTKKNR